MLKISECVALLIASFCMKFHIGTVNLVNSFPVNSKYCLILSECHSVLDYTVLFGGIMLGYGLDDWGSGV